MLNSIPVELIAIEVYVSLCLSVCLSQEGVFGELDLGELNLTSQDDDILDEAAGHIQENLDDELVQEALRKASQLRGRGLWLSW